MTYKDVKDIEAEFAERCDNAIEELYAALDDVFETMGQISPMFSRDYWNMTSQVLKSLKPWESAVCKNIDRAVNPEE